MDRETATLAGLGVVAVGESGVRAAARPARAVWGSRLASPARRLAAPAVDALVRRGRAEEPRLRALTPGGMTELAVGVAVDHAVVERAVAELLRRGVLEDVADQVAASRLPQNLVTDAELGRVLDELVDRLLASDQLQRVVTHIARSPEVREALAAQSFGLADEVAGSVRVRTASADDAAERVARRLLRRRPGIAPEPG